MEDEFPRATALAATSFGAVGRRQLLSLRLPLGRDSWNAILDQEVRPIRDLKAWRSTSVQPNNVCKKVVGWGLV
jgi:hypothetical protein